MVVQATAAHITTMIYLGVVHTLFFDTFSNRML